MYHKSIAVVDDEPDIIELVMHHLKKEGFQVETFSEARGLLEYLRNHLVDLIILDLMLPDIDGLDVCRILKKNERTALIPIIILTAKGDEPDRVVGLELGADDYVVKPFSPRELVARVKAVLRRSDTIVKPRHAIKIGKELIIDLKRYEVYVNGEKVDLTPTEFSLLRILAERKGWVFTRTQLLDRLWGKDKSVLDRTIDVHIRHLRSKLKDAGRFIKSVRGMGYKLDID